MSEEMSHVDTGEGDSAKGIPGRGKYTPTREHAGCTQGTASRPERLVWGEQGEEGLARSTRKEPGVHVDFE